MVTLRSTLFPYSTGEACKVYKLQVSLSTYIAALWPRAQHCLPVDSCFEDFSVLLRGLALWDSHLLCRSSVSSSVAPLEFAGSNISSLSSSLSFLPLIAVSSQFINLLRFASS